MFRKVAIREIILIMVRTRLSMSILGDSCHADCTSAKGGVAFLIQSHQLATTVSFNFVISTVKKLSK